jgi:uncharacterized peroxidase-related enzyme
MSRIPCPGSIEAAPDAAQAALAAVRQQRGAVANVFRVLANSPAALQGYLALDGALARGALDAQTRTRIALAVAETNGSAYCLSAHTYLARQARFADTEITANRNGASNDPQADAAVRFAAAVARLRGHVGDADLRAVRAAGYDDAQIVDMVATVAASTLTNYLNAVAATEIDFPRIARQPVCAGIAGGRDPAAAVAEDANHA